MSACVQDSGTYLYHHESTDGIEPNLSMLFKVLNKLIEMQSEYA